MDNNVIVIILLIIIIFLLVLTSTSNQKSNDNEPKTCYEKCRTKGNSIGVCDNFCNSSLVYNPYYNKPVYFDHYNYDDHRAKDYVNTPVQVQQQQQNITINSPNPALTNEIVDEPEPQPETTIPQVSEQTPSEPEPSSNTETFTNLYKFI